MLLEMWAYVTDVLAFYDEVIAHESYLRTARLRPSLRRLVQLLGYIPRPAVAAVARLALVGDGRQPNPLPKGTAFSSGAFDDSPPQIFELDEDFTVLPLASRWAVVPPLATTVGGVVSRLLLTRPTASLREGDLVLVTGATPSTAATRVESVEMIEHPGGTRLLQLRVTPSVAFPAGTAMSQVRVLAPTRFASLWNISGVSGNPAAVETESGGSRTRVTLAAVERQIHQGDTVVLQRLDERRVFTVAQVSEEMLKVTQGGTITSGSGSTAQTYTTSPVTTPASRILLDASINDPARRTGNTSWSSSDAGGIVVHCGFEPAGSVVGEPKTTIEFTDTLRLIPDVEPSPDGRLPSRFVLADRDGRAVEVGGGVDIATSQLDVDAASAWQPPLALPVDVFGNVAAASRGETVNREVLGSGDASAPNQSFTLKKKPLTYLAAPTAASDSKVASTLRVWVDGVRWTEVPNFFLSREGSPHFIVRPTDSADSVVIFGDGRRGARLPTGEDNVVATYRFGAEAAAPPASSITQLVKPVVGVTSVWNPVAAAGGADAEPADGLRTFAPRSALLLGRAISIHDMEAAAASVPGVRAVRAQWQWHGTRQRPVVVLSYIGDPGIHTTVAQTLRNLSDPTTPIVALVATGIPTVLSLDVDVDPRFVEGDVLSEVAAVLLAKGMGMLTPEQLGIDRPLYRSRVFGRVLSVVGVRGVRGIMWNGDPFDDFATVPGPSSYFDFESTTGGLRLNGEDAVHG